MNFLTNSIHRVFLLALPSTLLLMVPPYSGGYKLLDNKIHNFIHICTFITLPQCLQYSRNLIQIFEWMPAQQPKELKKRKILPFCEVNNITEETAYRLNMCVCLHIMQQVRYTYTHVYWENLFSSQVTCNHSYVTFILFLSSLCCSLEALLSTLQGKEASKTQPPLEWQTQCQNRLISRVSLC